MMPNFEEKYPKMTLPRTLENHKNLKKLLPATPQTPLK